MDFVSELIGSAFMFGLLAGIAVGVVPAVYGGTKGQTSLALGGFFACAFSGALFGLLMAVPVGGLFVWLISRKSVGDLVPMNERTNWSGGSAAPMSGAGSPTAMFVLVNGTPSIQLPVVPGTCCTLGRGADSSLRLEDHRVSSPHARIDVQGPGVAKITDLGSSNGTFVNGARISVPTMISRADAITVGTTNIRIA